MNYLRAITHRPALAVLAMLTSSGFVGASAQSLVSVKSDFDKGIVSFTPESPQVGDEVTFKAQINGYDFNGKTAGSTNLTYAFERWADAEGNTVSYDPEFTHTITEAVEYTAVFKQLWEKPRKGGYYRVRNMANRVLTLEGNYKLSMPSFISSGIAADETLLRWALDKNHDYDKFKTDTPDYKYNYTDDNPGMDVEANPQTIFYIESGKENGNNLTDVSISAQGTSTYGLTGKKMQILPMDQSIYPGYYHIYTGASTLKGKVGIKMNVLWDNGGADIKCVVYLGKDTDNEVYNAFAFQPLNEELMDYFWFGAAPDEAMRFEGGYWSSMYTAFPYECRDGVEAYYAKETATANGNSYICLTRIEDGRVPANTAVLLKCHGLETKENRLLPLDPATENIPAIEGNLLKGEFQLYTNSGKAGRKNFDESTMRVLGLNSKGEVGFFKLSAGEGGAAVELAHNRAYLDISSLPAAAKAVSFRVTTDMSGTAGVESVIENGESVKFEDAEIFDLNGRRVIAPSAGQVYIVNGKKTLWR